MRRSRSAWLVATGALAAIAAVVWWARGNAPPPQGPLPVPLGETVKQRLRDAEGHEQVWTLRKREVPREKLPDLVLPAPAPRESAPDARTESARALDAEALEAWKTGEIERAVERFEAAIEADPEDARPRSDYGRLLTLMTDYDRARPHLERAAELDPENPQVWVDLLSLYERTLLLERARYARRKAEERAGGRPLVRDETGLWRLEGESIFP